MNESKPYKPVALAALRRAAKASLELALRTGTPHYVMVDGKIVDLAKSARAKPKARKKAK